MASKRFFFGVLPQSPCESKIQLFTPLSSYFRPEAGSIFSQARKVASVDPTVPEGHMCRVITLEKPRKIPRTPQNPGRDPAEASKNPVRRQFARRASWSCCASRMVTLRNFRSRCREHLWRRQYTPAGKSCLPILICFELMMRENLPIPIPICNYFEIFFPIPIPVPLSVFVPKCLPSVILEN